jgi:hypothetical protein
MDPNELPKVAPLADPSTISTVDRQIRKIRQTIRPLQLASSSLYSVARPRGPPLHA